MRAILFIDGNNFYHSMREMKIGKIKEINYENLSKKLVKGREWVETRFYVGQLKQEGNHTLYQEQRQFINELKQYNQVSTHLGRVESHPTKGVAHKLNSWLDIFPSRSGMPELPEKVVRELRKIAQPEKRRWVEKAVDVMIATDMVSMAHEDKYDVAYLLSADGDFVPAITKVCGTGRRVIVASPVPGYKISQAANVFIPLKREFFYGCWK